MLSLILLQKIVSLGTSDDLIVNISDIHDIQYTVAKIVLQDPSDNVKCDVVSGMAHVCTIVHCWPALIPGQLPAAWTPNRYKGLFTVLETVVDLWQWDS